MTSKPVFILCFLCLSGMRPAFCAESTRPKPYNQVLLGYGTSHPGWGETTERVQTVDVVFRHCRHFFEKDSGWIKGTHEFWIEAPVSVILSDSDDMDSNDFGIVGLNFLFAWVFPETPIGSPYFMVGGGPQYVLADIEGVGSDLCGNYQAGGGIRLNLIEDHPINLELRFHHISNLGFAEPNVSLNSTKLLLGFMLPF
jgi:lipid A 3-O-deacylase